MEKKTNNKLLIVIVVLLVALIAACVVIWIGLSDKEEPQGGVGLTIDKNFFNICIIYTAYFKYIIEYEHQTFEIAKNLGTENKKHNYLEELLE